MEEADFLKKNLRKEIIRKRNEICEAERKASEKAFVDQFKELDLYKSSENILLFASYGSEISTDSLILDALSSGKKVFLPKVVGKQIVFYTIKTLADLCENGYKGIREPAGNTDSYVYPENIETTCLIMPGVCFDKDRNRLGYGGGFYDRFLADKPLLLKRSVAVGYKMQETEHIPAEEHDLKPGRIMLF